MTKVDIFSGFLGAGKTTLIKKLIEQAYGDEQIVLIENEFGEIGIDGGFMKDTGVQINQMNSGCICCTLVGDFGKALNQVIEEYKPERILIEPSGVGKLSDVIIAVQDLKNENIELNGFTTVIDAKKAKVYMKNFGEFYINQVEHASSLILSHTAGLSQEQLDAVVGLLRQHNKEASIVTTDWEAITGAQILEVMEQKKTLSAELDKLREEAKAEEEEHCCCHDHEGHEHPHHEGHHEHPHHHNHDHEGHEHPHHHDEHHECGCHHDHDHEGHAHPHHHDEHHECGCHHDHDHEGHEHHHDHPYHGHHHADEVFDEIGVETSHKYTKADLEAALKGLDNYAECGQVLRAKGIVENAAGGWLHFDYVPGEAEVREGSAETTGMLCVIGVGLEKDRIRELFGLDL